MKEAILNVPAAAFDDIVEPMDKRLVETIKMKEKGTHHYFLIPVKEAAEPDQLPVQSEETRKFSTGAKYKSFILTQDTSYLSDCIFKTIKENMQVVLCFILLCIYRKRSWLY